MASRPAQLNIRSDFAVGRVREIRACTGMSATQAVETALRAFPLPAMTTTEGFERDGWLLVGSTGLGRPISLDETNAGLDADRSGDRD